MKNRTELIRALRTVAQLAQRRAKSADERKESEYWVRQFNQRLERITPVTPKRLGFAVTIQSPRSKN
jgi:hypothetical protein